MKCFLPERNCWINLYININKYIYCLTKSRHVSLSHILRQFTQCLTRSHITHCLTHCNSDHALPSSVSHIHSNAAATCLQIQSDSADLEACGLEESNWFTSAQLRGSALQENSSWNPKRHRACKTPRKTRSRCSPIPLSSRGLLGRH